MRTRLLAVALFAGVTTLTLSLIRGQDKPGPPRRRRRPPRPRRPAPAPQAAAAPRPGQGSEPPHRAGPAVPPDRAARGRLALPHARGQGPIPARPHARAQPGRSRATASCARPARPPRWPAPPGSAARTATPPAPPRPSSACSSRPPLDAERQPLAHPGPAARHREPPRRRRRRSSSPSTNCPPRRRTSSTTPTSSAGRSARWPAPDGALGWDDGSGKLVSDDDGIPHHPGLALQALLASHRKRPADWKLDIVRKALPVYRDWWKTHQDLDFVATHGPRLRRGLPGHQGQGVRRLRLRDGRLALHAAVRPDGPAPRLWFGGFRAVPGRHAGRDAADLAQRPLRRGAGRRLPGRRRAGRPDAPPAVRRGAGADAAVPDDAAVHRRRHAALRAVVSAAGRSGRSTPRTPTATSASTTRSTPSRPCSATSNTSSGERTCWHSVAGRRAV